MKRISTALLIGGLVCLAACTGSGTSDEPKARNAALPDAACVPTMTGAVFTACKPFKSRSYQWYFNGQAVGGRIGGSGGPGVSWTSIDFARESMLALRVNLSVTYTDGSKMAETRFPVSFVAPSAPSSSPANPASCVPTMTGAVFTACKPFKSYSYQWYFNGQAVGGRIGGSGGPGVSWTSVDFSRVSMPAPRVNLSVTYIDGTNMPEQAFPVSFAVTAPTPQKPVPTTNSSTTTTTVRPVPITTSSTMCAVRISREYAEPCRIVTSYSYQWWNNTKALSGTMTRSSRNGMYRVPLNQANAGTTRALVSMIFDDGSTTQRAFVPYVASGSKTAEVPFMRWR